MDQNSNEKKTTTSFDVQDKIDAAEFFLDKNKKSVYLIAGAILLIAGAIFAYKFWYMPSQEKDAQKISFYSFQEFEKDSLNQAIKGGQKVQTSTKRTITAPGLTKIESEFSGTKTANLATYQLGCAYMRQGQFTKAIEKFESFSSDDVMLSSIALGAIGDCNLELKKSEEAIKYYLKAADKNPNQFSTPIFLKKAGMTYEADKKYAEALSTYERVQREYSKSQEARDMPKFITRVKILGNL